MTLLASNHQIHFVLKGCLLRSIRSKEELDLMIRQKYWVLIKQSKITISIFKSRTWNQISTKGRVKLVKAKGDNQTNRQARRNTGHFQASFATGKSILIGYLLILNLCPMKLVRRFDPPRKNNSTSETSYIGQVQMIW